MTAKAIGSFQEHIFDTLQQMRTETQKVANGLHGQTSNQGGASFLDHLKENITDLNKAQVKSDKMSMELATGQTNNIHETMLAASQAELAFNLMVQIRNKALEAYNEIMRIPV